MLKILTIKVEPYWNVKFLFLTLHLPTSFIKVEPYWNVKVLTFFNSSCTFPIKVEPYWNVKLLYSIHFQSTEYY